MTKAGAYHAFWNSFGIPAYEETMISSLLEKPEFPYIAYSAEIPSALDQTAVNASIFYRSSRWEDCNAKAEEIGKYIGWSRILEFDGGIIILRQGNPFSIAMGDPSDDMIKKRFLNVTAEFFCNR